MSRSLAQSKAVAAAKLYLEMRKYQVLEQNWRRSKQQIDIVAKKGDSIYLVNVYYRSDNESTSGQIQVLTTSNLQRLQQAADSWNEEHKWQGRYKMSAIEIGDPDYVVISFTDKVV